VKKAYTPKQGDIIWLDFNPQAGHEQAGRRPALVISNNIANELLGGRAMVCPITSTNKRLSLHPTLDERTKTQGVILCDQARMQDLRARHAEFIESSPSELLKHAVDIVFSLIEVV
jgi:mRNA interferase MazF